MKNYFLLASIVLLFACNNESANKETVKDSSAAVTDSSQQMPGSDRDEHGCIGSAGYRWSEIKGKCIRIFEDGVKLNPQEAAADKTTAAYVVFSDDNTKAELFAPGEKSSIILERNKEGEPWIKADWSLEAWKGWILKKGDKVLYAGQ